MFASTGFEGTSLREIAREAGVDIATVKYHFADKSALFTGVYTAGYDRLMALLMPATLGLHAAATHEQARALLVEAVRSFLSEFESHEGFLRIAMFRLLENRAPRGAPDQQLRGTTRALFDTVLDRMREQGVARRMDHRAVTTFLMSAVPMWLVTASRQELLGEPGPGDDEWHSRVESFLVDALSRLLLVGDGPPSKSKGPSLRGREGD